MQVRTPQVAGMFYDDRPEALRSMIDRFIVNAPVEPNPDRVCALIVPHAGYVFSGQTAAYGYKRVQGGAPGRIVLLGVSHRHRFSGIALCEEDAYQTPLGQSPIDKAFNDRLRKHFSCASGAAHDREHTLETQLPFIQNVLGEIPVVPLLFGAPAAAEHIGFGEQLAGLLDKRDLVIASTDMSHFFPEPTARELDGHTIDRVLSADLETLIGELREERCSMCGGTAVVATLACAQARGATRRTLLHQTTSAEFSGDTGRVVGYAAFSLEYEESLS